MAVRGSRVSGHAWFGGFGDGVVGWVKVMRVHANDTIMAGGVFLGRL